MPPVQLPAGAASDPRLRASSRPRHQPHTGPRTSCGILHGTTVHLLERILYR